MKVLLDTDIGSDIDDAICLAYLLAKPACDLLGITTVSGEPEKRAMLASAICKAAAVISHLSRGAAAAADPAAPATGAASDRARPLAARKALPGRRTPSASCARPSAAIPARVTLLAIGPMTNMALLFALDPEIPRLLKGLYMMIGAFTRASSFAGMRCEWNALNDPHATAIVYKRGHRSTARSDLT